jgi:phytoene synthase
MRTAGIDPEAWLANPVFDESLAAVIRRLLAAAEALYARGDAGIARLPRSLRPGMVAARLLYAEIGCEVARRGFDSVSQRAVVSWQRKAGILADAVVGGARTVPGAAFDTSVEAGFLLDTVADLPADPATAPVDSRRERARWPRMEDRVAWLVDLFERLERRDRAAGQAMNVS